MSVPEITLVTNQLPSPPRNGITLPLFHHLEGLRRTHRVRLCLLVEAGQPIDAAAWAENESRYGPITRITLTRRGLLRRVLGELRGDSMVQHGWACAAGQVQEPQRFAQLWVSPMSAVAMWREVRAAHPAIAPRASVAGVNDCTAAEYRWRLRSAGPGWRAHAKARLDGWRAAGIGRIEARLLAGHGRVLLQTEADRDAMRALAGEATARRCVVVPNGVREDLFGVQPQAASQQLLFVAELSGEYGPLVDWLCTAVWPRVQRAVPAARLLIIGRGASSALRQRLAATGGVTHHDHAPDLAAAYAASAVVWSPVFKGFGLINKTLEAMAAGLPVVGGRAAFNGIAGFEAGVHGVVLEGLQADALADATLALLKDPARRQALGAAARERVRGAFSWPRSTALLRQALADAAVSALAPAAPATATTEPRHV